MTPKERIQKLAEAGLTSNFTGHEMGAGNSPYTGANDPSVSFIGNASSFTDETKNGIDYTISITNTGVSAEDRILALHPGFLTAAGDIRNASGTVAAAIVSDGEIIATADKKVICSGKPKPIAQLQKFVNNNPTRFTGMKITVNNTAQFDEELYVYRLSPFKTMEDSRINPSNFKNSNQTDDKRVEIPLHDFQLDNQTVVVFTLKAGCSITITMFAGAIANTAGELNTKAKAALRGVQRVY